MSTINTTMGAIGTTETAVRPATKGFWQRFMAKLIAHRQEQTNRQLAVYINGLSDSQRKDIGYPSAGDLR